MQRLRDVFDGDDASTATAAAAAGELLSFGGCSYVIKTRSLAGDDDQPRLVVAFTGRKYLLVSRCPGRRQQRPVYVVVLVKGHRSSPSSVGQAGAWLMQLARQITASRP